MTAVESAVNDTVASPTMKVLSDKNDSQTSFKNLINYLSVSVKMPKFYVSNVFV